MQVGIRIKQDLGGEGGKVWHHYCTVSNNIGNVRSVKNTYQQTFCCDHLVF